MNCPYCKEEMRYTIANNPDEGDYDIYDCKCGCILDDMGNIKRGPNEEKEAKDDSRNNTRNDSGEGI